MVDYRYLGRSALKVSPLSLGTMMFGGPTPDDVAFRIIDKAREQGINFIDTADVYHDGKSEEVVGQGIKAASRSLGTGDQVRQLAQQGPEPWRPLAQVGDRDGGEFAAPPQHRLYRHPLFPPRRL